MRILPVWRSSMRVCVRADAPVSAPVNVSDGRGGVSIPNTLEIRPDYRFVVMVNKDMHMRPYVDHRALSSSTQVYLGPMVQLLHPTQDGHYGPAQAAQKAYIERHGAPAASRHREPCTAG